MATYIVLTSWTDQGIRDTKDTTKRVEAFREAGKKLGVTLKEFYWTLGQYDCVAILEAPNDEAVTALGLTVGRLGHVRTQTLRAFSPEEMGRILSKVVS